MRIKSGEILTRANLKCSISLLVVSILDPLLELILIPKLYITVFMVTFR